MLSDLLFGADTSSEVEKDNSDERERIHSDQTENSHAPDGSAIPDRRSSRRAPTRCLVRVWTGPGSSSVFGRLEDLSPSGCRLLTETTLARGQTITLEMTVLGRTPRITIEAEGKIKHIDNESERSAYGVAFTELDPSTDRALEWLYDREKALHPLNARPS